MTVSTLGLAGVPVTDQGAIPAKTPADYPAVGTLIEEFDLWRQGYPGSIVYIYRAGTTELAPVYKDPGMTQVATNPHSLLSYTDSVGNEYGKFQSSLYTPYAYELDIDATEQTGIQRTPLITLDGEDASNASVKANGSSRLRTLDDRSADTIHAEDFGIIGTSPTINTATLNAAIAAASANSGGEVLLPEGDVVFNVVTVPAGVILKGRGKGVTTLISESSVAVITISGANAGLRDLTLDGVELNTESVGLYSINKETVILENVLIKRFETGIHHLGGKNHLYRCLSIDNCVSGADFAGDSDASGGADGASFTGLDWQGGKVSTSTGVGVHLKTVDRGCQNNKIEKVDFDSNIGSNGAVRLYGAQRSILGQCNFYGNTKNIVSDDNPDTALADRESIGLNVDGGQFNGGELELNGKCQDFVFKQAEFDAVAFDLSTPDNQILLLDCVENDTTISGTGVRLSRMRQINKGNIKGNTTDATATVAWKTKVLSNEVIGVEVKVSAAQTNGTGAAFYHITHAFRCAPSTLAYDGQTANFTVGDTITGATSGATAVIVADADSGTTGTLSLGSINGAFLNDEIITGNSGGSATVNGQEVLGTVSSLGTATTHHSVGTNSGNPPAGWGGIAFVASAQEAQITVQGAASTNIDWNVGVDVTVL